MTRRLAMVIVGAALACTATAPGFAQDKVQRKDVEVGPVVGVNFYRFGGSDAQGFTTRTSFYAGLALTVPLGASAFLQPEVLYSAEGAKAIFPDSGMGTIQGTYKLAYLAVPVLFGARLEGSGTVEPRLFGGPVFKLDLTCEVEASAQGMSAKWTCTDAGLTAKSIAFGAAFGGAVALHTAWGELDLQVRYTYDFTRVYGQSNVRNEGLSAGAGLSVSLPR